MGEFDRNGEDGGSKAWVWPVGAVVLVAWVGISGFALPFFHDGGSARLLMIPGALAVAVLLAWAGREQLRSVETRWSPSEEAPGADEDSALDDEDAPQDEGEARAEEPSAEATAHPADTDPVHLGVDADPAFTPWRIFWETHEGKKGRVPLPLGADIVVGRSSSSDVVVEFSTVSSRHLTFTVTERDISVADLKSRNGTWTQLEDGTWSRLEPRELRTLPTRGKQVRLAHPTAVTFTIEPKR